MNAANVPDRGPPSTNRPTHVVGLTAILLGVGFVALMVIVGTTFWLVERAEFYLSEASTARAIRVAAVDLRAALQTAEASQRGYLVSGNQIYLAPYSTARDLAERQLKAVEEVLAPFPESRTILGRLSTLVADKIAEMDQTIALKRDRRDADALAIFRTNRGKALMDESNVFLSSIMRSADERFASASSVQAGNAALLRLITIVGGILIAVVVGAVMFTLLRYARALRRARDEVGILNSSLEQRVADRTSDLAQANAEIQRFAYVVTHDLRAPLVNIMGFTSELERGIGSLRALIDQSKADADTADPVVKQAVAAATADLPEAIGFIRSSTRKMDGLISAILRLSREGRRKLRPESVQLREAIEASAAAVRHQLTDAGSELALDLGVAAIISDRPSLDQIIGNLFDNAVKYRSTDRPLRITITSRALPGGRVDLAFADNGRGIADADRDRVFEPFRRAGTLDQPGEGIGLALVRTLARNLGGEVRVESALGAGTTFHLNLPARLEISESQAA
jgi:signal transduction histidine kinase